MTSIVGITALQELRKFPGFENAIIAGGFVRDSLMGGSFKDLDIFVPVDDMSDFRKLVEKNFTILDPEEKGIDLFLNPDDIGSWIDDRRDNSHENVFSKYNIEIVGNGEDRCYHITEKKKRPQYMTKRLVTLRT